MKLGYIRISHVDQNFDRQNLGRVDKLFQDTKSGSTADRVELQKLIEFARSGDEVICFSICRLARNMSDLQNIVSTLMIKGYLSTSCLRTSCLQKRGITLLRNCSCNY